MWIKSQNNYVITAYIQSYCPRRKEFIDKKYHRCNSCKEPIGYRCKLCAKLCASNSSTYMHIRNCHIIKFYKCACCSYKTKIKGSLQSHIYNKHDTKQCPECQKKFTGNRQLKNHRLSECKKFLQFKCNLCSFSCNLNIQLNNHIKNFHKIIWTRVL